MSGKRKKQQLRVRRQRKADAAAQRAECERLEKIAASGDLVPADPSQQAPNNSYDPPLYYESYEFTCVDCGAVEVWTAGQQKWWYEVAKGSIHSRAVRCRACRRRRREQRGRPAGTDNQ